MTLGIYSKSPQKPNAGFILKRYSPSNSPFKASAYFINSHNKNNNLSKSICLHAGFVFVSYIWRLLF